MNYEELIPKTRFNLIIIIIQDYFRNKKPDWSLKKRDLNK